MICGVRVKVQAPTRVERIERLLVSHFEAANTSPKRDQPEITIQFRSVPIPPDKPGDEVFRSEVLRVFACGERYVVWCGRSVLDIEPAQSRVTGFLDDGFRDMPPACQRVFLFLPFLTLFPRHGLYGVHANGLADGGVGYLIAGDSKHGKTTLSLALLREGWNYLSDDTVMLRASLRGVEALSFRRGFACDEETAARYPELAHSADPMSWKKGKVLLDVEHVYAGRRLEHCHPGVVIFSEIGTGACTELLPLDQTSAFTRLVRHSPFTLQSASEVQRHAQILRGLVSQAHCYRLRLGADVYRAPATVSRLLREIQGRCDA